MSRPVDQLRVSDPAIPPAPRVRLAVRVAVAAVLVALLVPLAVRLVHDTVDDIGSFRAVAVAPDGVRVAATVRGGLWADPSLRIWNSVTGAVESTLAYAAAYDAAPAGDALAWSPDGSRLAVGGDDGVITVHAADSLAVQLRLTGFRGTFRVAELGWSPDGAMIAASDDTGSLHVWRTDTGVDLGSAAVFTTFSTAVEWSPRSDAVALAATFSPGLAIVEVTPTGIGAVHRIPEHAASAHSLSWSPEGDVLAAGFLEPPFLALYRRGGPEISTQAVPWQPATVSSVEWSPTGTTLATVGGQDDTVRIFGRDGAPAREFPLPDATDPTLAWTPAGDSVASASETEVVAWPVDGESPPARWPRTQELRGSRVLAWTPDGRLLTEGRADHTVQAWRIGQADPVAEWSSTLWQALTGG